MPGEPSTVDRKPRSTSTADRERITAGLPPRVSYVDLNAKQKEIFNFQKVAALLADYGFNCIKLADDWQGADFLAYHFAWEHTLRVQLKTSLTIGTKYAGKGLHMAFHIKGLWHIVDHDTLVDLCGQHTSYLDTAAWKDNGLYTTTHPNPRLRAALAPYALRNGDADEVSTSPLSTTQHLVQPNGDTAHVAAASGPKAARFEIVAGPTSTGPLTKKHAVLAAIQLLAESGVSGEQIQSVVKTGPFRSLPGSIEPRDLWPAMAARYELASGEEKLWFLDDPIYEGGKTWVLRNNVWGPNTEDKLRALCALAPRAVSFRVV
ncbi:hypothetical protein [Mumia sp. DW29H23]|uniref:hypothetical protein n=1 Tax=Mumia sp. DW29H23 TaxID=3421241 RepID=UPI003D69A30B